jgi:predicted Rossmann-fold nucleotide-binding protein
LVGKDHWKGLVAWFAETLVETGAIEPDDLRLFKLVDEVDEIPEEIRCYNDESDDHAGFKLPTEEDRKKARGIENTASWYGPFAASFGILAV